MSVHLFGSILSWAKNWLLTARNPKQRTRAMIDLRMADKETLKRRLKDREGYEYDQADYLIDQAEYLFECRICDEKVFRNLIAGTWVLKHGESPRTIEKIVHRIGNEFGTLERLAEQQPVADKPKEWYEKIKTLVETFRWDLMGPVFVSWVKGARVKGRNKEHDGGSPSSSFVI